MIFVFGLYHNIHQNPMIINHIEALLYDYNYQQVHEFHYRVSRIKPVIFVEFNYGWGGEKYNLFAS